MSYQPNMPSGFPTPPPPPPPPVWSPSQMQQPGVGPTSAPPTPRARGRVLFWLGVASMVLGVAAGTTCIALSASAVDDTVAAFARAPQGCTTTLQFDHTGSFTLYFERRGLLAPAGGDCDMNESSYRYGGEQPALDLALLDPNGDEVNIDAIRSGATYDTERFEGAAIGRVTIVSAGEYNLSVSAESGVFAVAVGGDPQADRNVLLGGGIILFALGLSLGIVCIVLGRSRRRRSGGGASGQRIAERPSIPVATYTPVAAQRPQIPVTPPSAPAPPRPTWGPPSN